MERSCGQRVKPGQPAVEVSTLNGNKHCEVMGKPIMRKVLSWLRMCSIALLMLGSIFPAQASLGGDWSSVQSDQKELKGTLRSTPATAYTVHEIQAASGVMVREYVSPQGKVFGIAWKGPFPPNLQQVLGNYFEAYRTATKSQRAGRRPIVVEQPGLVVSAGGHMRSFSGQAYVPAMLPAGVQAEDIQ
jgi:hypothetical protein